MRRLYFDTNIYRFIRSCNEIEQIRRLLAGDEWVLIVSASNLLETYAIESAAERQEEMRALVGLADEFDKYPESWRHALELRREIKRIRPKWLRAVPSKRQLRQFLQGHDALWRDAQAGIMPDPGAYRVYRRDFERGVDQSRSYQKDIRNVLPNTQNFTLVTPDGDSVQIDVTDPEIYWRMNCLQVWYAAIEQKNPASRDYADWLGPYLRQACFRDRSYTAFWLAEVKSDALPLNRLTGLVDFYQLKKKISHGNATDQLHASQWLRSDLFVTADRAFHEILTEVASHYPGRGLPVLADRSSPSFASQLEVMLSSLRHR